MKFRREAYGKDVLDFGVIYKDEFGNAYALQAVVDDGAILLDCDSGEELLIKKIFRNYKNQISFTKPISLGYLITERG